MHFTHFLPIGGADENGLHHLAAEILDNSMDEAVAGHASRIEMSLDADGSLTIDDNGRGIPVDKHPKFKNRSALEVILTQRTPTAVVEDAISGVAAGHAGGFALVIGVDRGAGHPALSEHGADVVVDELDELLADGALAGSERR